MGLEGGTWPKGPTEAREEDFIPAWWQSIPNAYTGRQHDEGGSLNAYKSWDNLSIKEKSEMMKVAIRNGITNLADIKAKYNEFAEGGYMTSEEDDDVNMYDGISQKSQQMRQGNVYDMLPILFAQDGVKVKITSGYRPNSHVKEGGKETGRRSRHSVWGGAADLVAIGDSKFSDIRRVLDDPNSNTSKWLLANGYGYLDETSETGTTKYWHDRNRDHSHYHIGKDYGNTYASMIGKSTVPSRNYRDIAKQHIRQNEGWSATPYADGPNGWRSVGYGFIDSGFRAKYPGGIANYYAQRGGITKAEAERELDWFLNNMEASLRKTYGGRWDSFSDNQKAAIMDTAYQRPASVDAKSAFYAAVMSGNPNAGNLLGVKGFDKRNADRRNLFSSSAVQAMNPQNYGQQMPQMAYNPFEGLEPSNPQAFYGNPEQMGVIEQLAQQNAQMQAILDKQEADRLLAAQQQAEAEEKALQRNRTNLALQMVGMMGSDDGSSEFDILRPLLGNMGAYGGHLYDGETEPSGLMKKRGFDDIQNLNNDILDFEKNATSNKGFSTITDAETGEVGQIMGITPEGTYKTVYPSGTYNMTLDLPNTDVLGSKARMKAARGLDAPLVGGELKDNQYRTMPTNSEADAFADAWTEQTAPTVGHLISAGLKPLDLITPSRYVGLLDSDNKDGFLHLFNDNNRGFFIGNDPTKPFSKQFHDEHPILAGIGNTALDIPAGIAAGWTIGKGWNAAAPYVEKAYNAGKNVATTFEEIMPEIWNRTADKMHFPELKGFVNKKGQYYESRFNPFGNKTLQEKILEEGYSPNLRRGEHRIIEDGGIPRYYFSKINPNTGVRETVGVNPYAGGRIFEYNATSTTPDGMDLGIASIKRSSYGYKSPGPYKMGNQFDLALTAGTASTVDKNVLKTFGAGIQRFAPKGARITGDGAPSIADRVLSNLESKHYWDALKLAARRPMLPTNNALSTDSYRYLVGYGTKYPKFSTFYDGYDTSFNNAGVKYVDDINFLKTSPETLNDIYLGLDENYPGIINGRLPHPWIKKK